MSIPADSESERFMRRDDLEKLIDRIVDKMSSNGRYSIGVSSSWRAGTRWTRNRVSMASDQRNVRVGIARWIDGGFSSVSTNQLDDFSLQSAVDYAEWVASLDSGDAALTDKSLELNQSQQMDADTWSQKTADYQFADTAGSIERLTQRADKANVLAAGYFEVIAGTVLFRSNMDPNKELVADYGEITQSQCSITVRHAGGLGSGWAGLSSWDADDIDEDRIADLAMDKCLSSLNPVRIEPGRYTAILEPQAVCDIIAPLVGAFSRSLPEVHGRGPFVVGYDKALELHRSKLGLKIVDERITIWHDPSDLETGIISPALGAKPVTWVKNGVLTTLSHSHIYSVNRLGESEAVYGRDSFRMSGGSATLDDMIASSERAFLVTRFSKPALVHNGSMVASGLTRDGLWLIEKGRITHAVRNFRTIESPLFILNNVEDMGVPVRVFRPGSGDLSINSLSSVIVPPLKIRDFTFSSTIEAV